MTTDDSPSTALIATGPAAAAPPELASSSSSVRLLAADEVSQSLSQVLPFLDDPLLGAIVPWFCDKLRSDLSMKDYRRDLATFWLRMREQGVAPLEVTGSHVRIYKKTLEKAGARPASIARYLSVIRGVYQQLAIHGQLPWDVARDIQAIEGPAVQKNSTPALTSKQAQQMLDAIGSDTLKGKRDLALLWTYIITACRASALTRARVGDLNYDGLEYRLQLTEKRQVERNIILLDAAGAVLAYLEAAGIREDSAGPLFRPLARHGLALERRFLHRRTALRLVKHYCQLAGINPQRLGRRGIGVHSLRKTAINDAIAHGAPMTHVQALAGHRDIRTTQLYYEQNTKDAELAARRIQIRPSTK